MLLSGYLAARAGARGRGGIARIPVPAYQGTFVRISIGRPHLTQTRKFLFLQGPHGPFFRQLGQKLQATGAVVERVGFTFGDRTFWSRALPFTPYRGRPEDWENWLVAYLERNGTTDIVLYGDSRPLHKTAREVAARRGITVHCFEEGYLRPYWATYERGGVNGNSRLLELDVEAMRRAVAAHPVDLPEVPVQWGAIWHHAFYGFLYHLMVSMPVPAYRNYRPHREVTVLHELLLYIRRLAIMPVQGIQRRARTRRLLRSGAIYHLVLLQLSHDASLRSHSDFGSVGEFIDMVIAGFARGAPAHHILAFKAHPFEDYREPLPALVRKAAARHGVLMRVRYIPGGRLGPLLDGANSVVTVNSTAAQQALWRGLPVRAFGRSVFAKPELVSAQPLPAFFAAPDAPAGEAYRAYRQFLLETSQIAGGYYTQRGRSELLRRVVDLVLSPDDPYARVLHSAQGDGGVVPFPAVRQ